jgi:hypothetical protein
MNCAQALAVAAAALAASGGDPLTEPASAIGAEFAALAADGAALGEHALLLLANEVTAQPRCPADAGDAI